jgi:L-threonine kinase
MTLKKYTVKFPGSCGELMQGITGGRNFHVTCPINLFSEISISINKNSGIICDSNHCKSIKAMKKTLEYFDANDFGGVIRIKSEIPPGKGMASSTADISGVIFATTLALNETISETEIAKIALSIEPTDGTIFKNICLFDHKKGLLFEELGDIPENKLLVIDPGGIVDTIEFNKKNNYELLSENEKDISKALKDLKEGFINKNLSIIGECSIKSAILNQKILYKDYLNRLIEFSLSHGAFGINIAHSGTAVGIILPPDMDLKRSFYQDIPRIFNHFPKMYECKIISGGVIA